MISRWLGYSSLVFACIITLFGLYSSTGFAKKPKLGNAPKTISGNTPTISLDRGNRQDQQKSTSGLFEMLPAEMLEQVFSHLQNDRNRMLKLSKSSREQFVETGLFADPNGNRYRPDLKHLYKLGLSLKPSGWGQSWAKTLLPKSWNKSSSWKKVWFNDPSLTATDRHEVFVSSTLDRQDGLYLESILAGTGNQGFSGDEGPAIKADLNVPTEATFDTEGNLLFIDAENKRVRMIKLEGGTIHTIADGINNPISIASHPKGGVLVIDGNSVKKIDSKGGNISIVAGTGRTGYSGDRGPATKATFHHPNGIVADNDGNIIIADTYNYRLRKIDSKGIISTIAGTGKKGYLWNGGSAIKAGLAQPSGVTVNEHDAIVFNDNNDRRMIDRDGIISTIGPALHRFSGKDGSLLPARFLQPPAVARNAKEEIVVPLPDKNQIMLLQGWFDVGSRKGSD